MWLLVVHEHYGEGIGLMLTSRRIIIVLAGSRGTDGESIRSIESLGPNNGKHSHLFHHHSRLQKLLCNSTQQSTLKMGLSFRPYYPPEPTTNILVLSAPKKGQKMSLNEFLGDSSQHLQNVLSICKF